MANPNFWYARHFKDYAAKTAHLSLMEHGAYALLLDHYYQTGGKLIANAMAIARVCRCQTEEERNAVQSVLDHFFAKDDSGMYRNDRADREMGIAADVSAARSAAGKVGALARWSKSKTMALAMSRSLSIAEQTERQNDTQPQPQPQKNNMSATADAAQILAYLNERAGRCYQPVKANLSLIVGRLNEGATPGQCKKVIDAKAAVWGSDPKMSSYLRPKTLFSATNFAQYVGDLASATPARGEQWE
jgi:uncharacterized phage protein (TIGR02220 family)